MDALIAAVTELDALAETLDRGLGASPAMSLRPDAVSAWTAWAEEREQLLARMESLEQSAWRHLTEAASILGCALSLDAFDRERPREARVLRLRLDEIAEKSTRLRTEDAARMEFLLRARSIVRGYLDALLPPTRAYGPAGAPAEPAAPLPTTSTRA